jgi:hypothetical protein
MSHFFANALSIFLNEEVYFHYLQPEHFQAIRGLPSFRQYVILSALQLYQMITTAQICRVLSKEW